MLLLYFIFFIFAYSFYKNFTYFIGFIFLIILKIFNIDSIINNNRLIEGASFSSVEKKLEKKAQAKGDKLEEDSKKNNPPPNPAKSAIINQVQKAVNISDKSVSSENKKAALLSEMNNLLQGSVDVVTPKISRLF